MEPITVTSKLVGRSQLKITHADATCVLSDLTAEGAKLLRATLGPAADPVDLLDDAGALREPFEWAPDAPITVVVESSEYGAECVITAERRTDGEEPNAWTPKHATPKQQKQKQPRRSRPSQSKDEKSGDEKSGE